MIKTIQNLPLQKRIWVHRGILVVSALCLLFLWLILDTVGPKRQSVVGGIKDKVVKSQQFWEEKLELKKD